MFVPTTFLLALVFGSVAAPPSGEESLSPEAIQKVVRASSGAMRECYVAGLKKNRDLRGTLTTRFAIGRDGHVVSASEAPSSRFPDAKVTECVIAEFSALKFPPPDNAPVSVVYPIVFAPDD